MKNKIFSFIRLTRNEKFFFLHALLLLSKYRIRLKTTPIEQLITLVQEESHSHTNLNKPALPLLQVSKLIQAAAKLVPFSTCLSNALAGQILFAVNRHQTKLHIGVRKTENKGFEAHAWLTLDETILLGHLPDLKTYKELPLNNLEEKL